MKPPSIFHRPSTLKLVYLDQCASLVSLFSIFALHRNLKIVLLVSCFLQSWFKFRIFNWILVSGKVYSVSVSGTDLQCCSLLSHSSLCCFHPANWTSKLVTRGFFYTASHSQVHIIKINGNTACVTWKCGMGQGSPKNLTVFKVHFSDT